MHPRILTGSIAAACALTLIGSPSSWAASTSWTGGGLDALWSNTANWSASPVPGTGDTATFNAAVGAGGAVIDLGGGVTINTVLFDNPSATLAAYTIGSGTVNSQTLTLNNGGAVTVNANVTTDELFNAALVLGEDATAQTYTFTNNSATNALTFAGTITGGSTGTAGTKTLAVTGAGNTAIGGVISNGGATAIALTKSGAGTLTLSGANSFTGAVTISAGTVKLGTAGSGANTPLGTNAAGTTVSATGAALDLGGFTLSAAEALSISGTGTSSTTGALTNSGGAASYSGVVTIAVGGTTIGGAGDITLSAALATNTNSFTKVGAGKLTLQAASVRTGNTQIDGGTLRIENATAFGTAATTILIGNGTTTTGTLEIGNAVTVANGGGITFNTGGTILNGTGGNATIQKNINLQASGTGVFTFNSGSTTTNVLTINAGGNTRLTGGLAGAKLQIAGSGTVDIGDGNNTRTNAVIGDWYLMSGRLAVRADTELGNAANKLYFQGGTFVTGNAAYTSTRTFDFSNAAGGTIEATNSALTLNTAGQVTGANKLTKTGTNQLIISQAMAGFTGELNITGGSVRANDAAGLNTSSLLTLNGGLFETGANLARTGGSAAGNMQITGGASGFTANGANVQVAFGTLVSPTALTWGTAAFLPTTFLLNATTAANSIEFKNALDLGAANRTVQVDAAVPLTSTMSGNITGTGGTLTKTGNGILNLSGTNTYDTGTNVNAGILTYLNTAAKPSSGTTTVAAATTLGLGVGGAGFFSDTDLTNLIANTLAGVSMNATSGVGIDTTAGDYTSSAVLTGTRALTKLGANSLTLSGASNYTGTTTISGGTIKVGVVSVAGTSGPLGNESAVTLANAIGVTLDLNGIDTRIGSLAGGGASGGNVSLGLNTLTTGGNNTGTTYAGVISSSAGVTGPSLIKVGSGTLQLDRANTYSGRTVIDGTGTTTNKLYATEANSTLADAKLGAVPATPQTGPNEADNNIVIKNGGILQLASGTDGRSLSTNRGIYLGAGNNQFNTGSGDFNYNGVISGPGNLQHLNSGLGGYQRLYLGGNNTFTGDVYWDGSGSSANYRGFQMNVPLAFQNAAIRADSVASWLGVSVTASNPIQVGGATVNLNTLQLGGLLDGTGTVRSLASLTSNGTFTGLILNPTISLGSGGVVKSYSGVIGGTNEAGTYVIKTGAGVQELKGASTYTGATVIQAGELRINGIKNVGGVANPLGQPAIGNATISIGLTTTPAILTYNGSTDTTDRVINLAGTTGGATLDMSGSGTLTFSSNLTATGVGAKTLTLQGSAAGTGVLGGAVVDSSSGATSLTKTGSGAWTLNGASTLSGDTLFNQGTLTIGNTLALQNSALNYSAGTLAFSAGINTPTFGGLTGGTSLSIASNVTDLTLSPGTGVTKTYSGTLGSDFPGMNVIKAGAGTQILGAATYTGSTSVTVGKLYLNGTNTTTSIAVSGGATLGGNGSASSATATVADTGIVEAGSGGTGTLTVGGLTFSNTGTVNVSGISNYSINPAINTGALTASGAASSVTLTLSGAAPSGSGTVHLIQYAGAIGGTGFGAFALNTAGLSAGPRAIFNLANPAGYVDLSYSVDKPVWSGAGNGNWITSANLAVVPTTNWVLNSNSGTQTNFIASDAAVFNDAATGASITVTISAADVAPASATFDNDTKAYTLQGGFGITGSAALTKTHAALLTVSNDNSYNGGTTITGGTVQVGIGGTAGSLGSGAITNGGILDYNRSDTITVGVVISGSGSVVKDGSGTLELTGANSYGGNTTLNTGTLTLGNATALGAGTGTLIINGGTLDSGVASLMLTNNNAQTWNSDVLFAGTNDLDLGTGAVSLGSTAGTRTVTVSAGTLAFGGIISDGTATSVTKAGTGTLVVGGVNNYSGGTVVNAGTLTMTNGATLGAITGSLAVNNPNLGAGTDVVLNLNGSVTTGSLNGALATPSSGTNTATINVAANKVLTVNQTSGGTFDGVIAGSGALVKGGAAKLTLTGANTYSGGTTLNQGVLSINTLGALGANVVGNAITFNGGTLEYTDTVVASTNRLRISGGTVTFDITQSTGGVTITNPGGVSAFGNANFVKTGAGTLTLAGNVYFTDNAGEIDLAVNDGTMVLASSVTDPAFTWVVTNVNDVKPGATLKLGNFQGRQVKPNGGSVFVMSGGTFDLNGNFNNLNPLIEGTGTITNNAVAAATLSVYPSVNKTFSGNLVNGTGSLGLELKNTAGFNSYPSIPAATYTLTGNNTYSGATTVTVGILQAGSTTAFSPNSAYTVDSTLDLAGLANSIGSLTGSGGVALGGAVLTIGNKNTTPAPFTGVISSTGSGSVVKVGSGTLTLSGLNTYSGLTTVSRGSLKLGVNNAILSGNAVAVIADAGVIATLDLNGFAQTVGTALTSGLTLGGGDSASTIQVSGTGATSVLTLAGTTFALTYAAANDPQGATISTTAIDLNGAVQTFTIEHSMSATDDVTILSVVQNGSLIKEGAGVLKLDGNQNYTALTANAGTTNVNGNFSAGASVAVNNAGTKLRFGSVSQTLNSLSIGAGATVVFTSDTASGSLTGGGVGKAPAFGSGSAVVPEPGTLGLLLVGALGMLNRRRRQGH
ncbi:MAG: autotransporter-associated beta strand repeat-containing protein [Chthoniobacter sp.]|nr:autotransporter-associated beta strand repeat-containing protein [Chthoniobacter sp.]